MVQNKNDFALLSWLYASAQLVSTIQNGVILNFDNVSLCFDLFFLTTAGPICEEKLISLDTWT